MPKCLYRVYDKSSNSSNLKNSIKASVKIRTIRSANKLRLKCDILQIVASTPLLFGSTALNPCSLLLSEMQDIKLGVRGLKSATLLFVFESEINKMHCESLLKLIEVNLFNLFK